MKHISEKIVDIKGLPKMRLEGGGKKIGLCSGCFDVFHSGHAVFFEQCKELVDVLIVVVGSDSAIRENKGEGRPVNSQNNRAFLVASIENVDYAIIGEEAEDMRPGKIDFYNIMKELKPDVFILNNDDSAVEQKRELCKEFNVELKLVERTVPDFLKGVSSTGIIKQIRTKHAD
jgi:D-beta-D-heptose 7-phosphate kinase/D-beta-D-heptose 1-phosphate adenosyltransferase